MAEINIQRKERTTWPWILLGLLLVALLVWWLLSRNGGMTDLATEQDTTAAAIDTTSTAGTGGATAASGAIGEFVQWRSDYRARQEADTTHEFTAQGIRLLAAAIADAGRRVDTGGTAIAAVSDSIRTHADALQRDWQSTNHANHVRLAFLQAAGALERLREQGFPDAATTVPQVREAAGRVQPNRPLLEQRQAVQQFFDVASQTLQSMQGAASTTGR
jgi:hypothetical protein